MSGHTCDIITLCVTRVTTEHTLCHKTLPSSQYGNVPSWIALWTKLVWKHLKTKIWDSSSFWTSDQHWSIYFPGKHMKTQQFNHKWFGRHVLFHSLHCKHQLAHLTSPANASYHFGKNNPTLFFMPFMHVSGKHLKTQLNHLHLISVVQLHA